MKILYEGGLRIGEAINIWLEDLNINECSISIRKSKSNTGRGRKVFISNETINLLQQYIIDFHTEDVDTNYLFFNFRGKNQGKPLTEQGMYSIVKRLRKKQVYISHLICLDIHLQLNYMKMVLILV